MIPCQHDSSDSFKWFYKKDEHSDTIQILFQDKKGIEHYGPISRPRMRVLRNRSLVIDNLTEDDQGDYWCENCFQDNCQTAQPTVTSVKKGQNYCVIICSLKTEYIKYPTAFCIQFYTFDKAYPLFK